MRNARAPFPVTFILVALHAVHVLAIPGAPDVVTMAVIADDEIGRSPVPEFVQKLLTEKIQRVQWSIATI